MRYLVLLLSIVCLIFGTTYDVTFVNSCTDVVNVQTENYNDPCSSHLLTTLDVGQSATFSFDSAGPEKLFRKGSNGKMYAATSPYPPPIPASLIYPLSYDINVEKGFDVPMRFETKNAPDNGTVECLNKDCNSGKDWFGNTLKYVGDSATLDAKLTLTFCPH